MERRSIARALHIDKYLSFGGQHQLRVLEKHKTVLLKVEFRNKMPCLNSRSPKANAHVKLMSS